MDSLIKRLEAIEKNQTPVGTILQYASEDPPEGFVVCAGQELSITDYPELFKVIGETWGKASDPSNLFKLPDLRARFLRGADAMGSEIGPANLNPGGMVGDVQSSGIGKHKHHVQNIYRHEGNAAPSIYQRDLTTPYTNHAVVNGYPYGFEAGRDGTAIPYLGPFEGRFKRGKDDDNNPIDLRNPVTTVVGTNETRPINASVLFIIKAKSRI
jgi:microcystin-dependent protein